MPDKSHVNRPYLSPSTHPPDQYGHISLTGIVNIKEFSNVDFQIESTPMVSDPNVRATVTMGKLSGWTLPVQVDQFSIKDWRQIRSYKVIGPELLITIDNVPAGTGINIHAWAFLH